MMKMSNDDDVLVNQDESIDKNTLKQNDLVKLWSSLPLIFANLF